jgi:hypothetical protein
LIFFGLDPELAPWVVVWRRVEAFRFGAGWAFEGVGICCPG